MNRIQYMGDSPAFVDDFSKSCERSCTGSLHLFPKRLVKVTDDELEHLKKKRKDIFRSIRVLPGETPKPQPIPKVQEEIPQNQEAVEAAPREQRSEEENDSFSSTEKKKKKKKPFTEFP